MSTKNGKNQAFALLTFLAERLKYMCARLFLKTYWRVGEKDTTRTKTIMERGRYLMKKKQSCRLSALLVVLVLLFSACASGEASIGRQTENTALTWNTWNGYSDFLALVAQTYPDIELELTPYTGYNRTGYSWAQMRGDDIPDFFITSQILDEDLAKERLVDLSGYDFINQFSTALLDQVSIDGGIYLLPVNNAMYGIAYNKTLMEEHGWELPTNFAELEKLCGEIREEGLMPGFVSTQLTGNTFSAVFNLAKTDWLTTMEGVNWERDFLEGNATAAGMWEGTMDYVQKYIDIGMCNTDPEDRDNSTVVNEYLYGRKAVFFIGAWSPSVTVVPETGDELGIMPYISEDGSKNIYMYNPTSYIGISRRLMEPGNEEKLENAVKLLTFLFSPEGQSAFINENTPYIMSVLGQATVSENSMIYDAQQAMNEGRAFRMTYAHWENVLSDMGQAYKDWFRGENDMDGAAAIDRMDELQSNFLNSQEEVYFCESTSAFTVEETACLIGKALGSSVGADAAIIPYATVYQEGVSMSPMITGKLYQERINVEVANTILPGADGEYAMMTMTGAQAKELAAAGFEEDGAVEPFPYVLVSRGGGELEDDKTYQVAFLMNGYAEEVGQLYDVQVETGSLRDFLRTWLEEQGTVSPDGNVWE